MNDVRLCKEVVGAPGRIWTNDEGAVGTSPGEVDGMIGLSAIEDASSQDCASAVKEAQARLSKTWGYVEEGRDVEL